MMRVSRPLPEGLSTSKNRWQPSPHYSRSVVGGVCASANAWDHRLAVSVGHAEDAQGLVWWVSTSVQSGVSVLASGADNGTCGVYDTISARFIGPALAVFSTAEHCRLAAASHRDERRRSGAVAGLSVVDPQARRLSLLAFGLSLATLRHAESVQHRNRSGIHNAEGAPPVTARVQSSTRPADRLTDLFGHGVEGVELCGPASASWLHPEEAPYVERAVEKRRLEFAAGRTCARQALAAVGVPNFPLRVGEDRVPLWPKTTIGSITHTTRYCGAVACRRDRFSGIGVDVELRRSVKRELEEMICTRGERAWLDAVEPDRREDAATLLFSAKEAFYKAQFCVTGEWLDFQDVNLKIDLQRASFEVTVCKSLTELDARRGRLNGRFSFSEEHVFTGIALNAKH